MRIPVIKPGMTIPPILNHHLGECICSFQASQANPAFLISVLPSRELTYPTKHWLKHAAWEKDLLVPTRVPFIYIFYYSTPSNMMNVLNQKVILEKEHHLNFQPSWLWVRSPFIFGGNILDVFWKWMDQRWKGFAMKIKVWAFLLISWRKGTSRG